MRSRLSGARLRARRRVTRPSTRLAGLRRRGPGSVGPRGRSPSHLRAASMSTTCRARGARSAALRSPSRSSPRWLVARPGTVQARRAQLGPRRSAGELVRHAQFVVAGVGVVPATRRPAGAWCGSRSASGVAAHPAGSRSHARAARRATRRLSGSWRDARHGSLARRHPGLRGPARWVGRLARQRTPCRRTHSRRPSGRRPETDHGTMGARAGAVYATSGSTWQGLPSPVDVEPHTGAADGDHGARRRC